MRLNFFSVVLAALSPGWVLANITVGMATNDSSGIAQVSAALSADHRISSVTHYKLENSLKGLKRHDVLFVWVRTETRPSWASSLNSLLKNWQGKPVVVANFLADRSQAQVDGAHLPLLCTSFQWRASVLGKIKLASHPVLKGVKRLGGGASHYVLENCQPAPNTKVIALWDDGEPLIAVRDRTVHLNIYPPGKDGYLSGWDHHQSDGYRLLANAVVFAARPQASGGPQYDVEF